MPRQEKNPVLPREALPSLRQLGQAHAYARDLGLDSWEFALPIRSLLDLGASETDLRWLVLRGLLDHAHEVTTFKHSVRKFRRSANAAFSSATCFVLTEKGASLVAAESAGAVALPEASGPACVPFPAASGSSDERALPEWQATRRVLLLGGKVVKRFCHASANQELVLVSFQELGWPRRMDDPLPHHGESAAKQRCARRSGD